MSASDVIAIASAVIAIGALLVNWRQVREQKRKDLSDEAQAKVDHINNLQTELADRINAIQAEMTRPGPQLTSSRPMEMIVHNQAAVATLRALVPRAATLMEEAKRVNLKVNWFQTLVLAGASIAIGDLAGASTYVKEVVQKAGDETPVGGSPTARVVSLQLCASFYANRGLAGDADGFRRAFDDARAEIERGRADQGPFMSAQHMIELYISEAACELMLGETGRAMSRMAAAVDEWQRITAPGAKLASGTFMDACARNQQFVAPDKLLPESFRNAFAELQRTHDESADYAKL
ncbi:MAG TPA: hypothetical protein VMA77_15360 [Solirubrobacteraceae bacterium]|nr:hypothetical protein [Solirubrobacteraceae bacterium]